MHSVPTTTYRIQEVADDQNQLKNLRQDLTLKNIYRKMQLHLSEFKLLLALQSNLDYPDLDYPDFSIIRTFSLVPFFS